MEGKKVSSNCILVCIPDRKAEREEEKEGGRERERIHR